MVLPSRGSSPASFGSSSDRRLAARYGAAGRHADRSWVYPARSGSQQSLDAYRSRDPSALGPSDWAAATGRASPTERGAGEPKGVQLRAGRSSEGGNPKGAARMKQAGSGPAWRAEGRVRGVKAWRGCKNLSTSRVAGVWERAAQVASGTGSVEGDKDLKRACRDDGSRQRVRLRGGAEGDGWSCRALLNRGAAQLVCGRPQGRGLACRTTQGEGGTR